jgi:hypothetical protein
MNLQEQISRMKSMMGTINETKFFMRRVTPEEVAKYFSVFDDDVFFTTDTYEQFRYELVLKSLEHIMWQEYNMGWDELPEQEEIDYVNQIADLYDDTLQSIYDRFNNR